MTKKPETNDWIQPPAALHGIPSKDLVVLEDAAVYEMLRDNPECAKSVLRSFLEHQARKPERKPSESNTGRALIRLGYIVLLN
jgi:hypothetical protein